MRVVPRRLPPLAAAAGALVCASLAPAYAAAGPPRDAIPLPVPVHGVPALSGIGLTPDRLLTSTVPGRVDDREDVRVLVGPDGAPARVTVDQHLELSGAGDYAIRERGPARAAVPVGDTVPPVLKLGTVVWQGFSPGHRSLAARLTLDAGLEAARLPLAVTLRFRDHAGHETPLGAGGTAPTDGTLTVTISNQTGAAVTLPTGTAEPAALGRALDTLLAAARSPREGPPPAAGSGLLRTLPGSVTGTASTRVVAPLRVTGTVRVTGPAETVTGPGTTPLPDGARVSGTLQGSASFTAGMRAGGRVDLDLDVQPWLDPRPLQPPAGHATWSAWAAGSPPARQVASATTLLVTQAAGAARAAEFTPYLGADVRGRAVTTFRYTIAPAAAAPAVRHRVRPRPGAIAAASVAVLAVVVNAALLRRLL
jgi:hypothetical protein